MHEVAARGAGEAGAAATAALGGALTSPTDTGVWRFITETLVGPREEAGKGKKGKTGEVGARQEGAGLGGFVRDTVAGPAPETREAAEQGTREVAFGSGERGSG